MDVSKHLPSTQALREEPLHRWQMTILLGLSLRPVSYTHLDVYKRQLLTTMKVLCLSCQWSGKNAIVCLFPADVLFVLLVMFVYLAENMADML